jgi:hypothetical protein
MANPDRPASQGRQRRLNAHWHTSVLVFRGLWHLLDRVEWLDQPAWLWASLGTGLGASILALYFLNHAVSDSRRAPSARLSATERRALPEK